MRNGNNNTNEGKTMTTQRRQPRDNAYGWHDMDLIALMNASRNCIDNKGSHNSLLDLRDAMKTLELVNSTD